MPRLKPPGRKALPEDKALVHRVTMRLTDEDFRMLCDLRAALHLDGDGQTVRALLRLHYAEMVRTRKGKR